LLKYKNHIRNIFGRDDLKYFKHLQHYFKIYVCSTLLQTVGVRFGPQDLRMGGRNFYSSFFELINAIYLQSFDVFCEKKVLKTEQNGTQQNMFTTIFAPFLAVLNTLE